MIKNYDNLLAFNYALKELTKEANKPVASASGGAKPTFAGQPTSILKRVTFDPSLPTLYEHKRVLAGELTSEEEHENKATAEVAAFSSVKLPAKPPEGPPERADPNTVMTWNCNGVGPLLKNTDSLRELNDTLRGRSVDVLVIQEAKLRAHESGD